MKYLLGDSFTIDIVSGNAGEYGDIHILSTAFPSLDEMVDNVVDIVPLMIFLNLLILLTLEMKLVQTTVED